MIPRIILFIDLKLTLENLKMRKLIFFISTLIVLIFSFSACKDKNTEVNYQHQLNSVHNISLLQHTISEVTTTYIKSINDSLLIASNNSIFEGCYLRLNTSGTIDTLFMDYGTGSFVHDRWLQGVISVEISGGVNAVGSTAVFNFKTFTCDYTPKNTVSSEFCTVILENKTTSSISYIQEFTNFKSTTDTVDNNWAAMSGQNSYDYIKSGDSEYYAVDDTISISTTCNYIDYAGRILSCASTTPSQLQKDCSYLTYGKSQIDISSPVVSSGTLICNETPKICMSRFRFEMDSDLFEFEQQWLVK
jgi:hypothetical protein